MSARPATTVLSPRERMVVASYADGWSIKQVAYAIGITPETAKAYVKRARAKYDLQGRDASTKIKLGRCIEQDLRAELPPIVLAPPGHGDGWCASCRTCVMADAPCGGTHGFCAHCDTTEEAA